MQLFTHLPYRNNVSCVVFKKNKFLLVQLTDWLDNWWKFPQWGVDANEKEEKTALRELNEELGTKKFKIVAKSKFTNKYDWPDEYIARKKRKYRGQFQKFFLIEFLGENKEIKINKNEVREIKWVEKEEVLTLISDISNLSGNYKQTIEKILNEFSKEIRQRSY